MRHDEQTGLGRLFDDRHGIVSAAFPLRRIERGKQLMAFGMPAPPQVMGQLAQPPDGLPPGAVTAVKACRIGVVDIVASSTRVRDALLGASRSAPRSTALSKACVYA